jgi:hypothetical protein
MTRSCHRPIPTLKSQDRRQFPSANPRIPIRISSIQTRHRYLHKNAERTHAAMIRKLKSGEYRLYSRKIDLKSKKRKNLGTFSTRAAAEKHERDIQYFKRH